MLCMCKNSKKFQNRVCLPDFLRGCNERVINYLKKRIHLANPFSSFHTVAGKIVGKNHFETS